MKSVEVRGATALYFDAGQGAKDGQPNIIFIHGSGCDHSVWGYQSRYFAFHGWNLYAVDLPGHGVGARVSGGEPLNSIEAMADWLIDFMDAAVIDSATLVGHSMGSLIAIELASRHGDRVDQLVLTGPTAAMPVHPELLRAAADREEKAVDLMMDWGHGPAGHTGGNIAAGTWAKGTAKRMVMPRVADGTLGIDLAASNTYAGGGEALSRITAKTTVIVSQRARLTAPHNGPAVAEGIEGARVITLQDIGHFAHGEAPNDSLVAIKAAVR